MRLCNLFLYLSDGTSRIKSFGTRIGAIHDGVAAIEFKCVVEGLESLLGLFITRIFNPPVSLHEHSRTEVLVRIPPVTGTRSGAAGAKNALVHAIEFFAILLALQKLAVLQVVTALYLGLQPRLNALVLIIEIAHVRHQILNHVHVRERIDLDGIGGILVDETKTRQCVFAINVHRTTSANALSARTTKCKCGVLFVLDLK